MITSPYGWRLHPVTGKGAFHRGVDYGVAEGTAVVAPISGYVTHGFDATCGVWCRITGLWRGVLASVLLCHLSKVSESGLVAAGSVIGLSGATGRVTGPHLHVEVTLNGSHVDPLRVMEV